MQPAGRPIALDAGVIGFALLLTVACALLFGLAPAFQLARTGVREALAGTAGRVSAGRRTRSLKRLLVVVQVAVAVVLLAGSFLLVRNLAGLLRADLGFDPESLLSMRLTLPSSEYQGEAVPVFFDSLVAEVSALPGVGTASVAIQVAPFTRFGGELELRGREERGEGSRPRVLHTSVGDGYFEAMGLELLRGRPLDDRDRPGTPPAVVINQPAAERFFPGEDPLGKVARIRANRFDSGWAEVVGVVGAIRNVGPGAPPEPEVFTHHRQAGGRWNQMFLVVRADGDPRSLLPAIRRTVQRLDPEQPVYAVATGAEALAGQTAPRRVAAGVLTGFALAALALAALGIYGTVAQGVAERTREMGLRMALGAAERDVVALVVRESLATVGAGVLLGVLGALALARALASSFELVAGLDFQLLAAAAAALATAALLASTLPARRAGRLDPATSLREP
jgi:putative ABC transport system permease protein